MVLAQQLPDHRQLDRVGVEQAVEEVISWLASTGSRARLAWRRSRLVFSILRASGPAGLGPAAVRLSCSMIGSTSAVLAVFSDSTSDEAARSP